MSPNSVHTAVRIRPRPKNKPAYKAGQPPSARYTRVPNRSQPPDCVLNIHSTPDILHGSYLANEQSPASSHNTLVLAHTRSINIPSNRLNVKRNFVIFGEIFNIFLCSVDKSKMGVNLRSFCPYISSVLTISSPGGG